MAIIEQAFRLPPNNYVVYLNYEEFCNAMRNATKTNKEDYVALVKYAPSQWLREYAEGQRDQTNIQIPHQKEDNE
jgi:hypothetical protein